MKKPFKINWTTFWLSLALALVIAFAITTAIILNVRQKRLDDLKKQNEQIEQRNESLANVQRINLENFEIFIDKELL